MSATLPLRPERTLGHVTTRYYHTDWIYVIVYFTLSSFLGVFSLILFDKRNSEAEKEARESGC